MSTVVKVCGGAALAAAVLLFLVLDLANAHWRVPFYYAGDSLPILALAKGIGQGDWLYSNSKLGAPFGADWRDYPVAMTVDAVGIKILSFFTSEPGVLANLYWLATVLFAAAAAAYCLLRFAIPPWIAAAFGVVYALQPSTFFRNEQHLNLAFYHAPLLAAAAIELSLGRIRSWRTIPWYGWLAVGLQGFSYIYFAFFGAFFLIVASLLGWAWRQDRNEVLAGAALLGALLGASALNHTPSFLYWAREGRGPAASFKTASEADTYGLKLRHMLTPIQHHPFYPFRRISEKLDAVHFPIENENTTTRLGSVQALGLLMLLAYLLCAPMGKRLFAEDYIGTAAVLFLCGVFLANVGGLGGIFNTFVAPDIRSYNRISFYLAFFCLLASATVAAKLWRRGEMLEIPVFMRYLFLAVFLLLVAGDQSETALLTHYGDAQRTFMEEEAFVRQVEAALPAGSRVLELPYTPFPNDGGQAKLAPFDEVRPYLHSASLRWSWGGVPGRNEDWNRVVETMPPKPMIREACLANFQAIWLDEAGYAPGQSPRDAVRSLVAAEPLSGMGGRIQLFDLRPVCPRILGPHLAIASSALSPVIAHFGEGFSVEESDAEHAWRWSQAHGELLLINHEPVARNLKVSWRSQNGSVTSAPLFVRTSDGERSFPINNALSDNWVEVRIPPNGESRLSFRTTGPRVVAPGDSRELYFALYDFAITDAVEPARAHATLSIDAHVSSRPSSRDPRPMTGL